MAKTPARILVVSAEQSGRRLDNFLSSVLKTLPKSFIYRIIRRGEVRVNGGRARPHRKLLADDKVRVPPITETDSADLLISRSVADEIARAIIFENDSLIVVNKPSGFAVHAGSGLRYGVIDVIRQLRPDIPDVELVHRIDRETSGCLVIAKDYPSLRMSQKQLNDPTSCKTYRALLHGRLPSPTMEVNLKLNTVQLNGEKRSVVDENGKRANTEFSLLDYVAGMSYVEAKITTGRTHQIRAHAAAIEHAIVGDKKYTDNHLNIETKTLGLNRMFLHALSVDISLNERAKPVTILAPLAPQLERFLNNLR